MCKCLGRRQKLRNEEQPDQAFPQLLLALIRIQRKAYQDYHSVEEDYRQICEMQTILLKLTITHMDTDDYANYLFKRAEQLSSHLETYKNIIGKIEIGSIIEDNFSNVSQKFVDYLKERVDFKCKWIEAMQMIELGKQLVRDKVRTISELQTMAKKAYDNEQFIDLGEIGEKCHQEMVIMEITMDDCLNSGKECKEYGSHLYEQLTILEVCFQDVVKLSMNRINEMKRTPATISD